MLQKVLEVLKSSNFKVSLYSIIILAVNMALGTNLNITGEDIYNVFNVQATLSTILLFSLNSVIKIYSAYLDKGKIDFSFLKSTNFINAVLSVLMLIVGAVANESISSFILVILTQILNSILHISNPTKTETTP